MKSKPVTVRRIIAAMKMPRTIGGKITRSKTIWDRSQASTWMTGVTWPAGVDAAIADLDAAEVQAQMRTKGAVQDRNTKLGIVLAFVRAIEVIVQGVADTQPANAETIILDCAFSIRTYGQINKQDFTVKNGSVSGQVILNARPLDNPRSHEWGMTSDIGATKWIDLPPTTKGHAVINGQGRGSVVFFRHREISKTGPSDWEVKDIVIL